MKKKNVEDEVNQVLAETKRHHDTIWCQLCTGPFWSTPVGDRTKLIDTLTEHLVTMHAERFEQIVRES